MSVNLIDKKSVINKICDTRCMRKFSQCPHFEPCEAIRIIQAEPAVDAAPVVHGEWIKCGEDDSDEGDYYCSTCNHEKFFPLEEPNYNYCPHCGAKMDGGAHV